MDDELIIISMLNHLVHFVEKPHPAFANMPPCPFAKKARIENKIKFVVFDFSEGLTDKLKEIIQLFPDPNYEILWVINPNKKMPVEAVYKLIESLNDWLNPYMETFGGHPNDPYESKGVKTRREPYPNFVVQVKEELNKARSKLKNTKYYD